MGNHFHLVLETPQANRVAGMQRFLNQRASEAGLGGGDLGIGKRLLYRCLQLARAYPILSTWTELPWSLLRTLSAIEDNELRAELQLGGVQKGWTARQLQKHIRPGLDSTGIPGRSSKSERESDQTKRAAKTVRAITPKRGTAGVYRIISSGEGLAVDLGFTSFFDLTTAQADGLKAGDLVRFTAGGGVRKADEAKKSDLYTYSAELLRVVDGDTLWMKIYLRPRHRLKEKLRLRGLDFPEMDTAEGKAAKQFVERLIQPVQAITITTTKPDKYDRYLSDIFLTQASGKEIFLNGALFENGHAAPKDSYALRDWLDPGDGWP